MGILDPITPASINSGYLPKWKPNTAYSAGFAVLSPSGDVVTAKTGFTSGSTYSASNWNLSSSYAQINASNIFANSQNLQGGLILGSPSVSTMPPGSIRGLVPQSYSDNPGDNIAYSFQSIIYGDWTPDTGID